MEMCLSFDSLCFPVFIENAVHGTFTHSLSAFGKKLEMVWP